jgi:exodeoxyribonuclease V
VVLCWTNPTRHSLNNRCRRIRGLLYQFPQPGEPIICLKNAPSYGVFNGEVYQLLQRFTEEDDEIVVSVEGRPVTIPLVKFIGVESEIDSDEEITTWFDYGYALTVHKSQGSEWDNVLLVDEFRGADRAKWLYTGITRAAERMVIQRCPT